MGRNFARSLALLWTSLAFIDATAGESITNFQAGYHDGFYLQSEDANFKLKVGARLDFGLQYGFLDAAPDYASFDLVRAKVFLGGNVFSPDLQFYVQAAAGSNDRPAASLPVVESSRGGFTLEDFFVRAALGAWTLKGGQFKVPSGRQWMIYSGNLEFVDRSVATRVFALGRDRGVTGEFGGDAWRWTTGVFNGGGSPAQGAGLNAQPIGTNGQNASNDAGNGFLYLTRLAFTPLGDPGLAEGDVERSEGHRLQLAATFSFDHQRDVDPNGDAVVDDTDADAYQGQFEAAWKHRGWALASEAFYRWLRSDPLGDGHALGAYAQTGFMVTPKLETAARVAIVDPDVDVSRDLWWEACGALNLYFLSDHRYKIQGQYTLRRTEQAVGSARSSHFADLLFQLTI